VAFLWLSSGVWMFFRGDLHSDQWVSAVLGIGNF
jgi:hypothetical protein